MSQLRNDLASGLHEADAVVLNHDKNRKKTVLRAFWLEDDYLLLQVLSANVCKMLTRLDFSRFSLKKPFSFDTSSAGRYDQNSISRYFSKLYRFHCSHHPALVTSCIFDSLGSLLWEILGFTISDATWNLPALSARLCSCGISDWIWEDKSKTLSLCILHCSSELFCSHWFLDVQPVSS